ncbi:MAG TPA: serine hydrolase [Egibacteraceae bacterium]
MSPRAARLLSVVAVVPLVVALLPGAVTAQPRRSGIDFATPRTLREGTPEEAGLVAAHLDAMDAEILAGMEPGADGNPLYPGAVVLAARDGVIAKFEAWGESLRYADGEGTLLPASERIAMRRDTIFDLASVSKLFTSIAVVQLVEEGLVALDDPVAAHVPEFAANGKAEVTVLHLLTHTSGLPAWLPLYSSHPTPEARMQAALEAAPLNPPDTVYRYSDLNLIALGELVERVSGLPLDAFVAARITGPLGMTDTGYNPPASERERIAATEFQPWTGRGMVHGSVHDENAWSLGGVAGHAGVFSTARDLAVLAQTIVNGGRYGSVRILSQESVEALLTDYNAVFPGNAHGLGFELYQHWYMDAMATPHTAGHTGYTGTSLVLDPEDGSFVILLTNRVHPSRDWGSVNAPRRAAARALARAVPVRPASGRSAWFSGLADGAERTLTATVPGGGTLRARLWWDTEPPADTLTVEASLDGGETFAPLSGTLRAPGGPTLDTDGVLRGWSGRRWYRGEFPLPGDRGDELVVRFRYATDALYSGRGAYVDEVVVPGSGRVELVADGWVQSPD